MERQFLDNIISSQSPKETKATARLRRQREQESEPASERARAFERARERACERESESLRASASNSFSRERGECAKRFCILSNFFLAERNLQDPGSMDPFTLGKFGSPCSRACMDHGGESGQTKPVNNY